MPNSNRAEISIQQKLAIVTLIKEMLQQLDQIAALRRLGREWESSMQALREMALILEFIPEHLLEAYFEIFPVIASGQSFSRPFTIDQTYADLSLAYKRSLISKLSFELLGDSPTL